MLGAVSTPPPGRQMAGRASTCLLPVTCCAVPARATVITNVCTESPLKRAGHTPWHKPGGSAKGDGRWGSRVGGQGEPAGPAWAPAKEMSPSPLCSSGKRGAALPRFPSSNSPETVGNKYVTVTDCTLSARPLLCPRELIFNNSADDVWRSRR